MDFCDCDDEEADYLVLHKSDAENCPESDRPWQDLQERIMDVQPLTQDEIDSYEKRASYHETEIDRAARLNATRKTKK